MSKFTHTFKGHFEIASGNEKVKAETLTLPSPSNYIIGHVTVIDQEFSKAMIKMSELSGGSESKADDDAKVTGKEMVMMLSSSGANMKACYDAIQKICIKQGMINGEQKVTQVIFDRMAFEDTKEILGGYINDFLFSSLVD